MTDGPDWLVYAKIILQVMGILWMISGALSIFNQLIIQRFKLFLVQHSSLAEILKIDFLQLIKGMLMLLCGIAIHWEYAHLLLILLPLLLAVQGTVLALRRRQNDDSEEAAAGKRAAAEYGFFQFSLLITLLTILLYLQGAL